MSGIGGGGEIVTSGEEAGFRGARAMFEQMNKQRDAAAVAVVPRHAPQPSATAVAAAAAAAAARAAESAPSDRRPFKEAQNQKQQHQQQPVGQVAALARHLHNAGGFAAGVAVASNGAIGSHGGEYDAAGQIQRTPAAARIPVATGAASANAPFKQSPATVPKLAHPVSLGLTKPQKTNEVARKGTDAENESWPMPPAEMRKLMREMQCELGKRHEGVCPSQAFVHPTATGDASSRPGTNSSGWKKSPPPPPATRPAAPVALQKNSSLPVGSPVARRTTEFDAGQVAAVVAASAGRAAPNALPGAAGAAPLTAATMPQTQAGAPATAPRTPPPPLPTKPKSQPSPTTASGDADEPVSSPSAGLSVKAMAQLLSNATAAAAAARPPASDGAARRPQVLDESGVAFERIPFPGKDVPSGPPPPKPASLAVHLVTLPTLRWAHEKSDGEHGSSDTAKTRKLPSLPSPPPPSSSAGPRRSVNSDSSRGPPPASRQIVSIIEPMQSDEEDYDDAVNNEVFPEPPQPMLPARPPKLATPVASPTAADGGRSPASSVVQGGDEDDTYDDVGVNGDLYDDAKPEAGAAPLPLPPPPRSDSISSSSSEPKAPPLVDRKESKKRQKLADQEAHRLKKEEQERLAREQLAQEEEKRLREKLAKKAAKVKQALEKDQAKICKKFKLKDGDQAFIKLATMREAYSPKAGTQELPYSAEEVLYVVVKDGCPKGKWLARNSANLLGFIAYDAVVGSSMSPGELGSPLADPVVEDEEDVEYADADDVAEIKPTNPSVQRAAFGKGNGSASGGGGPPAVLSEDTYDDTGAAESEQNEDFYEMAE